ncbi:MAG TPA: competence/damage-inducible protein A [Nitrospiria bacterium]|nr:competence/damage-inducible protein A [Nitrospiria bacterium]
MGKTAAILIIGNEILSGKITDENAAYLSRELRSLGVDVQRIAVVPDEESAIAEEVATCSRRYDWLFTTGGVGPTHDDVTIAGIARGLGRKVVRDPQLEAIIKKEYGPSVNEASLKLAEVPEGAELLMADGLHFPIVTIANIYIFPGIPRATRRKFTAIKALFQDTPFFIKKVYLKEREEEIAHDLHAILKSFPHLLLGSYPVTDRTDYHVILTLESKDAAYLESAFRKLLELIPKDKIVKTE